MSPLLVLSVLAVVVLHVGLLTLLLCRSSLLVLSVLTVVVLYRPPRRRLTLPA